MTAQFYTLTKRNNDTTVPSGGGVSISIRLKDDTDILSPAIELQSQANPTAYNYAYLPDLNRYYFVSSWSYNKGVWSAICRVDVLASWLEYIRATSAQVVFSSSQYSMDLLDNRVPATGVCNRKISAEPFVGASLAQAQISAPGTFCLTALDNTGIWATGSTTTYFMTYQQMQVFARELINPATWESLKQFFENPMDAIVECYYLPLDISSYIDRTAERSIVLGSYTFPTAKGRSALATNLAVKSQRTTIDIPWQYEDYRNLPPYTTLDMFVPFCGSKPLPTADLYGYPSFFIEYSVDISTGAVEAVAYLKETVLQEWSGNIKVTLAVGQTQSRAEQIIGGVSSAVTALAGFSTGNVALGATGTLSAIGSVISPTDQKMMGGCSGSVLGSILGSDIGRWQKFILSSTSHTTVASPGSIREIMGNPNGNVLSLARLTGYCQTAGASVSSPCTDRERDMINALLDGGIYFV